MESEDIPVCNLFNAPAETQASGGEPSNKAEETAELVKESLPESSTPVQHTVIDTPTSPEVCNIFQHVQSSEDLFSNLIKSDEVQKPSLNEEVTGGSDAKLEDNDQSGGQIVSEVNEYDLEEKHSTSDMNLPKEDPMVAEASDMMTSIMIHDDDSFENISNLSLDQSSKEEPASEMDAIDPKEDQPQPEDELSQTVPQTAKPEALNLVESIDHSIVPNQPSLDVEHQLTPQSENTSTQGNDAPLSSILFASKQQVDPFSNISQEPRSPTSPDDIFTHALTSSESDRRRDAWIPIEDTQAVLTAVAQSQKRITLETNCLVRPGLATSESLGDPIKLVLARYKGNEFIERNNLTAESVTPDKSGLEQLILTGNLRAAVDLTGIILTNFGQGFGKQTQESVNTAETLQWWNARLSLLVRLKLFDLAENEMSEFAELNSADLFYGFYPDTQPGRQGSMVPFSFRLLHAEFPRHLNKPGEASAKLHGMLEVCNQILINLNNEKSELGTDLKLKPKDKAASLKLWTNREVQVLYAIGNTLIQLKEYQAAINIYDEILTINQSDYVALQSGIGRVFLQLGDIKSAQLRFAAVEKAAQDEPQHKLQLFINRGFLYLGANKWDDALQQFNEALKLAPQNLEALNNKAVCLLYLCRLKEAISTLENAINFSSDAESRQSDNRLNVQHQPVTFEGALNNLVTLYELESTRSFAKKQLLLQQMALTVGDGFDVTCLKM